MTTAVFKSIRDMSIAGNQCSRYGHRHQPFQSIVPICMEGASEKCLSGRAQCLGTTFVTAVLAVPYLRDKKCGHDGLSPMVACLPNHLSSRPLRLCEFLSKELECRPVAQGDTVPLAAVTRVPASARICSDRSAFIRSLMQFRFMCVAPHSQEALTRSAFCP